MTQNFVELLYCLGSVLVVSIPILLFFINNNLFEQKLAMKELSASLRLIEGHLDTLSSETRQAMNADRQ